MGIRLADSGLVIDGRGVRATLARGVDTVLRGISQVMLQDNSYAGALFVIGIAWNSWLFAVAALVGCGVSSATAALLGMDPAKVRAGLYGFNGALVGIALLYFLAPNALTWLALVLATACSTVVMAALETLLARWRLPAFTAPFVFVSWCFFLVTARFGRLTATALLPAAGLPHGTPVEGVVGLATVAQGLFNGIAEVFFQANVITGVLFALGLALASWRIALAALAGALSGLLVAWLMGAAEPAIRAGAFGFNGVLVAIALAGALGVGNGRRAAYALMALLATPFVYAALSAALQPFGIPALTFPFVLVTWTFLAALPALTPRDHTAADPG
ncbi:MAG TPA: urea transporter [Rhodanobacteraceae bacterium]|nr:urea transporter [Rhodanobacteraceae bacterium]